jgi:hypothetical protein
MIYIKFYKLNNIYILSCHVNNVTLYTLLNIIKQNLNRKIVVRKGKDHITYMHQGIKLWNTRDNYY